MQSTCFLLFIFSPPRQGKQNRLVRTIEPWLLRAQSETYLSCSPLSSMQRRSLEKEKKSQKMSLLVQWRSLSNCGLIHSKQNGKCLSNETESVFVAQSEDQTCSVVWQAFYVSGETRGKWRNIQKALSMLYKIPSYQLKLSLPLSVFSSSLRNCL